MKKWFHFISWSTLLGAPLLVIFSFWSVSSKLKTLDQLKGEAERIQVKMAYAQSIQQKESALLAPLKNFDPHYLDKHVETLSFLLPEIKKLEAIYHNNLDDEGLHKRLQALKSSQNRLVFSEGAIHSNQLFKEVEEHQQMAVEMNEEDLKNLLCLLEGTTIWPYGPKEGKPLFLITDFKLSKKDLLGKEKVFVVSLKLLKREGV